MAFEGQQAHYYGFHPLPALASVASVPPQSLGRGHRIGTVAPTTLSCSRSLCSTKMITDIFVLILKAATLYSIFNFNRLAYRSGITTDITAASGTGFQGISSKENKIYWLFKVSSLLHRASIGVAAVA